MRNYMRSVPSTPASLCWSPKMFRRCAVLCLVTFVSMLVQPAVLYALPQGGSVAAGEASISVDGAAAVIDQFTDRAVINWQGFDIDINELVQFIQDFPQHPMLLIFIRPGQPSGFQCLT